MRKLLLSFSLTALLLPALSLAQENQPQPGVYCPHLTRDLKFRDRDATTGGQVTELQKFLADYYDLDPSDYVTGYFGRLTQLNVIRFQREQNLPAFGYVGPLTRAAIARVCGITYTPPPPTQPLPAPTCILNANPSSITLGQSSILTWSSTNATHATISSIGAVSPNGSQSVSPLLTTTYFGTFWNTQGTTECSTTLTVTPQTTTNASCIFNNQSIPHGQSVTAYQSSSVPAGQQCVSQTRTCTNGILSGSYQYATCSVATATCTPDVPQTQTLSCPTGQTGSVTQTRTSTCPGPTWGAWTTTSNTCVTTITNPEGFTFSATPSSGPASLAVDFAGHHPTPSGPPYSYEMSLNYGDGSAPSKFWITCNTGINGPCNGFGVMHIYNNAGSYTATLSYNGAVVAEATIIVIGPSSSNTSGTDILITRPSAGPTPLSVAFDGSIYIAGGERATGTLDYGDGSSIEQLRFQDCGGPSRCPFLHSYNHVYTTSGTYTAKLNFAGTITGSRVTTANIRVDGPVASIQNQSPNQSQLASALTALESALKAILQLLGQ